MPASPVRPRALGGLVAAAVLAGLIGSAGAPAAAALAAPTALAATPATPVAPVSTSPFAGPPPETESPDVVHGDGDGHDHTQDLAVAAARAAAVPQTRAAVAAAATKVPGKPTGLPTAIEPLAQYVAQADCDPSTKAGARALGKLLTATYPNTTFGGGRACTDHPPSEHYDGRAVDWMNTYRNATQRAQANALLTWLFAKDANGNPYANARRLGVMYIIWNNKIWGSYNPSWRPYNNCATTPQTSMDTTCHRDHMHFSLSWEGAQGRTSYWTKKVAAPDYGPCRPKDLNWAPNYTAFNGTPCPRYATVTARAGSSSVVRRAFLFSGAQLGTASTGAPVVALQNALRVTNNGKYGTSTIDAVRSLQQAKGVRVSGTMNQATWRALLAKIQTPEPPTITARLRTFNVGTGVWAAGTSRVSHGVKGDVPVAADYTGDGVTDLAVYRPSTGQWLVRGAQPVTIGKPGDVPVPGRYGTGSTTSIAVFRPGDATWHVNGAAPVKFGTVGATPVPADYDGDGRTEFATYAPTTGTWTVPGRAAVVYGKPGDLPVAADYNGDGKAELAVYRPSTGRWMVQGAASSVAWGTPAAGDLPVPFRYDAGQTADLAVWRPSTGQYLVRFSASLSSKVQSKAVGRDEVPVVTS
jgi:peptidoglycan hydrolase-like protein with peptidoglycan-binding domain